MKKKKTKLIIILSIVVLVLVGVGGSYAFYVSSLSPVSSESHEIDFTIESGETSTSILSRLVEEKIIKNALATKVYAKISGNTDFKAGDFILDTSWSTKKIVQYLNDSSAAKAEQVTVTIVEGSWAKNIAAQMAEATNVSADDLLKAWNDSTYVSELARDYWFITPDIYNSQKVILEGYLYPSTYNFFKETTVDAITRRFLDQTEKVLDEYKSEIESSSMSVHQIMTLASIIQFEGKHEEDMKLISGVFENRIAAGMKLQSSVTVCYALYNYTSWSDCEQNTDIDSAYNTYQVEGLPPGPILNPGLTAIKAALEPTASDYLYFMADVNGDGTIYFAKTYAEHLRNVDKYLY